MSVRTAEELSDRLATDFIWRKRELTVLAKLVSTASADREAVLVRSLITILYAHWEGYLKLAAESYLEYLANRRLTYAELASNFVALGLQPRIRDAASRANLADLANLIGQIRDGSVGRSRLPTLVVATQSNLSSRVLRDITTSLGIDFGPFATKKVHIDERLVRNRNHIAHGDYLAVDVSDVLALRDEIITLMEHFRNEIENAVALARYREPVAIAAEVGQLGSP